MCSQLVISPGTNVTFACTQDGWRGVDELTHLLRDKGWFHSPPSNSHLLKEPACAWLTADKTGIDQRHKYLPCLNKDVTRKSIQKWIELHLFPPCAGVDPDDPTITIDLMENFVAFFWADYTVNHKPVIPALTNVGRFLFTYIWRSQHSLMR